MAKGFPYASLSGSSKDEDQRTLDTTDEKVLDSRTFEPNKQTWRLFREQAARLFLTALLVAGTIVALRVYENKKTLPHRGKISFNVVITILNLALGLNFLVGHNVKVPPRSGSDSGGTTGSIQGYGESPSLEGTCKSTIYCSTSRSRVRWRKLNEASQFNAGVVKKSLDTISVRLLGFSKPILDLHCADMIKLAQASIALLGLTYSMDGGTDSANIITSTGMVNVPLLNCYYDNGLCATRPKAPAEIVQNVAHSYGEITRGQLRCPYTRDIDIRAAPQNCTYFYNTADPEFAFRYSEYNPKDDARAYPYLTGRIIKTSASDCYQYEMTNSSFHKIDSPDGLQDTWVLPFHNETYNGSIPIPRSNAAFDSTTYVYNETSVPQNLTMSSCGPRCISLYAFRSYGTATKRPSVMFKCSVMVGEVSNAVNDTQQLPDMNARLAAASIALTGRYTNPYKSNIPDWQQYQLYPYGSYWETQDLDAATVGSRMSEFAIGSLAAMANLNPQTQIRGTLPMLGYQLSVEWKYVIALAAGIASVHCLLVALMLWISRPVIVGVDSNLATARMLKGLVEKLGDGGGLLDDREMAEAIQRDIGDVGYGVRESDRGPLLELGERTTMRKRLPGGRFPTGQYA
ncbi:MAG: hypothetical protein Q9191_001110 [Dirinaria sp. TL-2023a]